MYRGVQGTSHHAQEASLPLGEAYSPLLTPLREAYSPLLTLLREAHSGYKTGLKHPQGGPFWV